jgi:SAM-dependent methyltransferase
MKKYFETNKILWNNRTDIHVESEFYEMENFLEGKNSLKEIELELLAEVKDKSILHLQCHFGQDSLSLARMGAKVTGLDISEKAISKAQELNSKMNLDAKFVCANVYDTGLHIQEQFDIVFASYGALCWLHDLDKWAKLVADRLKPGGKLILVEFHPVIYMYNWENHKLEFSYFNTGKPYEETVQGTYADKDAEVEFKEYFWTHSLSEIIQSLINNKLNLSTIKEYDYSPYNCFDNMFERAPGKHVYGITKENFPHGYALEAIKK